MWSLTLDVDLRALATCTLYVTYYGKYAESATSPLPFLLGK